MTTRDTSGFAPASHQSQALCLGTLGCAGLLVPIAVWGFDSPWRLSVGIVAAAGGAWLLARARWHWKQHHRALVAGTGYVLPNLDPDLHAAGSTAGPLDMSNPNVLRLLHIAKSISESLVPLAGEFTFEGGDASRGALMSYGLQSLQPGFFATEATKSRIDAELSTPFGDGWRIEFDSQLDRLIASRKSAVPSLVTPEMWPVIQTREEAARNFPNLSIAIGVGENGPIRIKPKDVPHREVVGATGGGKSVAVRAELMQYFAALYRVFAVDGKGTDYSPFMKFPNVTAVSSNLHEHILVIHMVWMLLKQRQRRGTEMSKRGDTSWRDTMTPILLVLDEFASVRSNMKAVFKPKEIQLIERDMVDILKVGREFRVNVILATQDMKADTVPSDWLDMFKVVQSLGKPGPMVVRKAFPEQIQGEVARLGGTISPKTPGRALVTVADDAGRISAEIYQSYWSYSPAETISDNLPPGVKPNWEQFKREVSDRIPRVYPRMWVRMEYPLPEDPGVKDPYEEDRGDGWVDLAKMTVMDLHRMLPINLEDPKTIEYIDANAMHDPLSDSYLGVEPLGQGATVISDY
ncbi:type IV secretory system conjugative DNA transfer family protein [Mycolicibacterium sp.]|uniref:type IV secretory system conjugative DNA transfer family protein n=1 Tax=Mycolicibacterium sp. TaxID=2320850 RepID=UPI00355D2FE5